MSISRFNANPAYRRICNICMPIILIMQKTCILPNQVDNIWTLHNKALRKYYITLPHQESNSFFKIKFHKEWLHIGNFTTYTDT